MTWRWTKEGRGADFSVLGDSPGWAAERAAWVRTHGGRARWWFNEEGGWYAVRIERTGERDDAGRPADDVVVEPVDGEPAAAALAALRAERGEAPGWRGGEIPSAARGEWYRRGYLTVPPGAGEGAFAFFSASLRWLAIGPRGALVPPGPGLRVVDDGWSAPADEAAPWLRDAPAESLDLPRLCALSPADRDAAAAVAEARGRGVAELDVEQVAAIAGILPLAEIATLPAPFRAAVRLRLAEPPTSPVGAAAFADGPVGALTALLREEGPRWNAAFARVVTSSEEEERLVRHLLGDDVDLPAPHVRLPDALSECLELLTPDRVWGRELHEGTCSTSLWRALTTRMAVTSAARQRIFAAVGTQSDERSRVEATCDAPVFSPAQRRWLRNRLLYEPGWEAPPRWSYAELALLSEWGLVDPVRDLVIPLAGDTLPPTEDGIREVPDLDALLRRGRTLLLATRWQTAQQPDGRRVPARPPQRGIGPALRRLVEGVPGWESWLSEAK